MTNIYISEDERRYIKSGKSWASYALIYLAALAIFVIGVVFILGNEYGVVIESLENMGKKAALAQPGKNSRHINTPLLHSEQKSVQVGVPPEVVGCATKGNECFCYDRKGWHYPVAPAKCSSIAKGGKAPR
jgi:hypothetical protein